MQTITTLQLARKIASVVSVDGRRIVGVVDETAASNEPSPADAQGPQIGALVKVRVGETTVYGLISRLWSNEARAVGAAQTRSIEVDIIGMLPGRSAGAAVGTFQRGVSAYPRIGAEILETSSQDVARVYAASGTANVRIGSLHQDSGQPVHVAVDQLLGKHFAILGTTGSGKSCAAALVLRAILDAYPCGHIVILDPHNEYARAFSDRAEILDPTMLRLPYWLLNFEESAATFCSQDGTTREYEAAILKEAILTARRDFATARGGARANVGYLTVDTPAPYFLDEAVTTIEKKMGNLEKPAGALPYIRLLARIEALRADERLSFMFSRGSVDDTLADIVCRLLRIPVEQHPITIVDLSGTPSEIVDVLVSVMCRIIFDFALWSSEPQAVPTLLVCEEAHRYAPRDERLGFEPTRRAIGRIAMEGRKYGVSLCLVTNRPSEISSTMLAQCNTIFALRMSNQQDHDFVRSALPEDMGGLVGLLPALRPQEAIAMGEGVAVPLRLRFDDLPEAYRPRSSTAAFSGAWARADIGRDFVWDTIARWRHQRRLRSAPVSAGAGRPLS